MHVPSMFPDECDAPAFFIRTETLVQNKIADGTYTIETLNQKVPGFL